MAVSSEVTFELIGKLGNRPAVFTHAETSAAIGGINNPVVYTLFLFSVCFYHGLSIRTDMVVPIVHPHCWSMTILLLYEYRGTKVLRQLAAY